MTKGLAPHAGRSNTEDIWGGLIGERIAAVFEIPSTYASGSGTEIWLVMESGYAFVYRRPNGSYWVVGKEDVDREISKQRRQLQDAVAKLGRLGTVGLVT